MREVEFLEDGEVVAAAEADRHRRPLPDPVHGQDGGFLERRGEKRRGGVTLVMLGEEELAVPVAVARKLLQLVVQQPLLEQLFAQPQRDRHPERAKAVRRECEVGFQQAFELEKRLVVEHDVIDGLQRNSRRLQAIGEGMVRETGIMLLAREALLLRRRHDTAVFDQGGRAVVIECRKPDNAHSATSPGQKIV